MVTVTQPSGACTRRRGQLGALPEQFWESIDLN
jgi:hypothetical protein